MPSPNESGWHNKCCLPTSSPRNPLLSESQMLNVWNMYLHLGHFWGLFVVEYSIHGASFRMSTYVKQVALHEPSAEVKEAKYLSCFRQIPTRVVVFFSGGWVSTPLKNGVKVSWDDILFPIYMIYIWKVIKFHGSSHHQAQLCCFSSSELPFGSVGVDPCDLCNETTQGGIAFQDTSGAKIDFEIVDLLYDLPMKIAMLNGSSWRLMGF